MFFKTMHLFQWYSEKSPVAEFIFDVVAELSFYGNWSIVIATDLIAHDGFKVILLAIA